MTLSYGLRWEYFPLPKRLDQGIGLYNPDTNTVNICGYSLVPSGCNVRMSKRMFAPRIGIAWRVRPASSSEPGTASPTTPTRSTAHSSTTTRL